MIGKLKGLIDKIFDDKCLIDVNGVFYVVYISYKTSQSLKNHNQQMPISLVIETIVKEDAIELYGFITESEKIWFLELLKVQGVGAKMAQKILSAMTIEDLARALSVNDIKSFNNISGIGPKLASRLTTELKDSAKKLGILADFEPNLQHHSKEFFNEPIANDAISALENLGYKKHDCQKIVNNIFNKNPSITLENLITQSLRELSKK